VIYVYAIGDPQPGVDAVCEGDLAAFVRRGVARPPAPEHEALARHDRVVASLAERGAVLPMRFGSLVDGERGLRELLTERGDQLRQQLDHVRGRVEIGVRAVWADRGPCPSPAPTGRAFMQAKLDRHRAAQRKADELHEPLAGLAADSVLTLCPHADTAFSAAYLVERAHAESFAQRASSSADELTVTGPWPPYSFSG
jgi:hypothetical protein